MEDLMPMLFAVFFVIVMVIRGIASLSKQGQQQGEEPRAEESVALEDFANRAREMLYGEPEKPATKPPEFGEFDKPEPFIAPTLQDLRTTLVDQVQRLVEPEVPVARRAYTRPAAKRRPAPTTTKHRQPVAPKTPAVTTAALRRKRRTEKSERLFTNLDDVRRGIVLSEILRPPKAFR